MVRLTAASIPGSEVVVVGESGHSLYWEQPEVFNRALLEFFARHRT
jgi:pimeloyl-ACP methyl ester carboxylesterase